MNLKQASNAELRRVIMDASEDSEAFLMNDLNGIDLLRVAVRRYVNKLNRDQLMSLITLAQRRGVNTTPRKTHDL